MIVFVHFHVEDKMKLTARFGPQTLSSRHLSCLKLFTLLHFVCVLRAVGVLENQGPFPSGVYKNINEYMPCWSLICNHIPFNQNMAIILTFSPLKHDALLSHRFWAASWSKYQHYLFNMVCCDNEGKWTQSHNSDKKNWICEK